MRRILLLLCLALPLAACSDFPKQGFVTRSLGGTVVDAVPGAGPPSGQSPVYTLPEPIGGEELRRPDDCTQAAQSRADDVKAQGFDEAIQKQVYDATFKDCRKQSRRQ